MMSEQPGGPSQEFRALLDACNSRYEDIKPRMLYYQNRLYMKTSGIPTPYFHDSMSGIGLRETPTFIIQEIEKIHRKRIESVRKRLKLEELNHPHDATNLELIEWYIEQLGGAVRCAIESHKRNEKLIEAETAAGKFNQGSEISDQLDDSATMVATYYQHARAAAEWLFVVGRSLEANVSELEVFIGERGGNFHLSDGIAEAAHAASGRVAAMARVLAAQATSSSRPCFPADHYRQKYGLAPNTLNKARRNGRLPGELRGGRWFYLLDDVRKLWPDVFMDED